MKAYLAAPIFTERDRNFNTYLETEILKRCPSLDLYLAQNNASINDKKGCATSADIYVGDVSRLKEADLLLTIMSGDLPPIGSSYETAYFCALCESNPTKRIIALYDDCRDGSFTYSSNKRDAMISGIAENQWSYINLLAVGYVKKWGHIYHNSGDFIGAVEREYKIGTNSKISGIYKITNLKNNLSYIGQSIDIYERWRIHKNNTNNDALHTDIQQLGLGYFKFEIIEKCDNTDLLSEREQYWINYYDSYNNGYNLTGGGEKGQFIGDTCIPVYSYNLDGTFNKEYHSGSAAARDLKISSGTLWRTINFNDSNHTCGDLLWRRYKTDLIEPYIPYRASKGTIYAYDPKTRLFCNVFESQTIAGEQLTGKRQPHISDVLKGKRKTCCGYIWAYDYYERLPNDYFDQIEQNQNNSKLTKQEERLMYKLINKKLGNTYNDNNEYIDNDEELGGDFIND